MARLQYKDISKIRAKNKNKKIVFCSGGFDLTHAGHLIFLENCKKLGDILVVGIGPDKIIKKEKGNERPIINEDLRLKMVEALKPVDWAFILTPKPKPGEHPLSPLEEIVVKLDPDIYVINDDAGHPEYRKAMMKKIGVKFVVLKRVFPISTTSIIEKIKNIR